jgi:hypothetical protein
MKWRTIAIAAVIVVAALAVNAFLVSRSTRPAEAFDGGRVLELDGPDLALRRTASPASESRCSSCGANGTC